MNFKQFLVQEGLLDIDQNMNRVFQNPQFVKHVDAYMKGDDGMCNALAQMDLSPEKVEIPRMETTGKIAVLLVKRNPIFMKLSDGTEASFTYDEWKRIKGDPGLGKTVTIVFQRSPEHKGKTYSKIEQVIVH